MKRLIAAALIVVLLGLEGSAQLWFTGGGDYQRRGYAVGTNHYSLDDMQLLWTYEAQGPILSSPVVADFGSDGRVNVIFGSDDGNLYVLDDSGRLVFRFNASSGIRSSPTVYDVTGNGINDVAFGCEDGTLYVIDAKGNEILRYQVEGAIRSSPLVMDLGGRTRNEIVFTSLDKNAYCIHPNGELVWKYETQGIIKGSAAAFDIDNDGSYEVIFGSEDNQLYVLKHPPHKVWTYDASGYIEGTPSIIRGGDIILGSFDGRLYRLRKVDSGQTITRRVKQDGVWIEQRIGMTKLGEIYNYLADGPIMGSAAIGPVDRIGTQGIAFGSGEGTFYMIWGNGSLAKRYTTGNSIVSQPAMADINGDGMAEVVFADTKGKTWILGFNGTLLFEYFGSSAIRASPAIADINSNGALEVIVGSTDGSVYVFGDRIGMQKDRAISFFESAKESFSKGEGIEGQESLDIARSIYEDIGYEQGIVEIENYIEKMDADHKLSQAKKYHGENDFERAMDILAEILPVYKRIGYSSGAQELYKLIEADLYFMEAQILHSEGHIENATAYVTAARAFYREINHTEGLAKTMDFMNHIETEQRAGTFIKDGMIALSDGRIDDARLFFEFARLSYEVSDDLLGMESTGEYIRSADALELYISAEELQDIGEYERALKLANDAIGIYENLSTDEFENERKNAVELFERINVNIWAKDLYDRAQQHYLAASYEIAMEYANRSMALYLESQDEEGYMQAENLYLNSKNTFEMMGGTGSRRMPLEAIAFGVGAFLLWIFHSKKVTTPMIKGVFWNFYWILNRKKGQDGYGGIKSSGGKIGGDMMMESGDLSNQASGKDIEPRGDKNMDERMIKPRFGHRVVLEPENKGGD